MFRQILMSVTCNEDKLCYSCMLHSQEFENSITELNCRLAELIYKFIIMNSNDAELSYVNVIIRENRSGSIQYYIVTSGGEY